MIYPYSDWHRTGPGSSFPFYITNIELCNILVSTLQCEYAPFYILCTYNEKKLGKYVQKIITKVNDLITIISCYPNIWKFYIYSDVLSPGISVVRCKYLTSLYSINGLIELQHGMLNILHDRSQVNAESSLSIIAKIRNEQTNDIIKYKEYKQIYNALIRKIKKLLIYKVYILNLNGEKIISKVPKMSEEYMRLFKNNKIVPYEKPILE